MTQAFPEKDHSTSASVSILERMNAFIANMKFSQNFKSDILGGIPGEQFSHFFRNFAWKNCLIHTDNVRTFLVVTDRIPVGAILKDTAFQFIVELFDQFLAERLVNCF